MGKDKRISALDRAIQTAMGADRLMGRTDDPAKEAYPALWEWLSRVLIGADRIKQPATLTIRLGPEGVLATLTDRDLSVSVDVACAHLECVYAEMEAELNSDTPAVRSWGKREPNLRKRKLGS